MLVSSLYFKTEDKEEVIVEQNNDGTVTLEIRCLASFTLTASNVNELRQWLNSLQEGPCDTTSGNRDS